jgi:hypothetical protein
VIAETARISRDLPVIDHDTDLVRNLAVLTGYRADLIADRVRMINRLRDLMTSVFPSLEPGIRLLLPQGSACAAHWLREPRSDPPRWADTSGRLATAPSRHAGPEHLIDLRNHPISELHHNTPN